MNVARPARCVFCSLSRNVVSRLPRRQFHSTPIRNRRDEDDDNVIYQTSVHTPRKDLKDSHFKHYTEEEKARIAEQYSPEQIAAIEAGEKSIDPKDLAKQFIPRNDPWALKYLDDFSTIEPAVDHNIRTPITNENHDPNSRLKNEEEILDSMAEFIENMPEEPTGAEFLKFADNMRLTVGKEQAETNQSSSVVPDIFNPGEEYATIGQYKPESPLQSGPSAPTEEISPDLKRLLLSTGYSQSEVRSFRLKTLVQNSVANQTRLGKVRQTYFLTIAGNGDGLLGIGEGKGEEAGAAMIQARYRAIRNMKPILRYEKRTTFGDLKAKVGGTDVVLMHRPPGFGLRCQHNIWEMCRAAGIYDIAARVGRSRNPMNAVKATYKALMSQRNPEDIARGRGRKLVDVRKVYYAGNV